MGQVLKELKKKTYEISESFKNINLDIDFGDIEIKVQESGEKPGIETFEIYSKKSHKPPLIFLMNL